MVSKIVILAAVALAPAVQAFTPGQLEGVWYCENDGNGLVLDRTVDLDWQTIPEKEVRTFYFEKPISGKKTLLSGSMYRDWTPEALVSGTDVVSPRADRHDRFSFKGTITTATSADLTLNPNSSPLAGSAFQAEMGPQSVSDNNPFATFEPVWSFIQPQGPYTIHQVDADHFTLDVYSQDKTGTNCSPTNPGTACLGDVTDGVTAHCSCTAIGNVISTEKCVRGLPRSDKTCAFINTADSTYLTGDDADRVCRGNLACVQSVSGGNNRNFGECGEVMCCSAQTIPVAPPSYYQPPYNYQQPQYNPYFQSQQWRQPSWNNWG